MMFYFLIRGLVRQRCSVCFDSPSCEFTCTLLQICHSLIKSFKNSLHLTGLALYMQRAQSGVECRGQCSKYQFLSSGGRRPSCHWGHPVSW